MSSCQFRAVHVSSGQFRAVQGSLGQFRAVQDSSGQFRPVHGNSTSFPGRQKRENLEKTRHILLTFFSVHKCLKYLSSSQVTNEIIV